MNCSKISGIKMPLYDASVAVIPSGMHRRIYTGVVSIL
jgi:hypothetical protein